MNYKSDTEPPRNSGFSKPIKPSDSHYYEYKALLNGQSVAWMDRDTVLEWFTLNHPAINGKAENIKAFPLNRLIIEPPQPKNLLEDIKQVINCRSAENGSNTPDWILAEFLTGVLHLLDETINKREKWYGHRNTVEEDSIINPHEEYLHEEYPPRKDLDIKEPSVSPEMYKQMVTYLNYESITSENIGEIRRKLFLPFECKWNSLVRDETAKRENKRRGTISW